MLKGNILFTQVESYRVVHFGLHDLWIEIVLLMFCLKILAVQVKLL